MRKKMVKAILAGTLMLAMVGSAFGATYQVNVGGASAQGDFWRLNGRAYLLDAAPNGLGCTNACANAPTGITTRGVIQGTGCTADGSGTNDDTVYITYTSVNSSFGCGNYCGAAEVATQSTVCTWDYAPGGDCADGIASSCPNTTVNAPLNLGCADVECTSLVQTSTGYKNGRTGFLAGNSSIPFGSSAGFPPAQGCAPVVKKPVIVPFTFTANNRVTKTRCTAPMEDANTGFGVCNGGTTTPRVLGACSTGVRSGLPCTEAKHCPIDGDLVYDQWASQCVPGAQRCLDTDGDGDYECDATGAPCALSTQYQLNPNRFVPGQAWLTLIPNSCAPVAGESASGSKSSDCIGFYKCVGPEKLTGEASNVRTCVGGAKEGQGCVTADQCPGDREPTVCTAKPIDNLSRLQALLLFSGSIKNWKDFGPWYPDLPVALCARHGGSGTHATMDLRVMRNDAVLVNATKTISASDPTGALAPRALLPITWNYESSSTQLEDCVEYYHGGVGYMDVDKALVNKKVSSVHHMKHEGVEPFRSKTTFGEYVFWSANTCQYDNNAAANTAPIKAIMENLSNWAANAQERIQYPTNLFWATGGAEMTVNTVNDFGYPKKK